jgi:hypothetical protein
MKAMTTRQKADKAAERAAEEKGKSGGQESNARGTAAGPGSSSATHEKGDNQRDIGGAGSDKTAHNRPGHKTHG